MRVEAQGLMWAQGAEAIAGLEFSARGRDAADRPNGAGKTTLLRTFAG
jgi:ABC-type transport system involved in cytochrome c biogenesis ATPase subunit